MRTRTLQVLMAALVIATPGCAREESAWITAKETGTIHAYQEFLEQYPAGTFVAQAQTAITSLTWKETRATNTQDGYQTFLKQFPDSPFTEDATTRSRDFTVRVVGSGEITLSGSQNRTRRGPIVELSPQWTARVARLNDTTSYATDEKGNRVSMLYLVPVDLSTHKASSEPVGGGDVGMVTWIPPVNTFTRRYNAFGTADQKLGFVFEFSDDTKPVRLGLIYDKGLEQIAKLHILKTVIPLRQ